jgi:hypothetical protein
MYERFAGAAASSIRALAASAASPKPTSPM